MRMTSVIILAASLQLSANSYSQRVSIKSRNISVDKLFRLMNRQTGYSFFWDDQVLASIGHVTIDVRNMPLPQALDLCLSGTPLTYSIVEQGKAVFISKKSLSPPGTDSSRVAADETIHGEIRDSTGAPLEGVSVSLKSVGFSRGTATDKKGQFSFPGVPDGSYTLEVTSVGYSKYEKRILVNGSSSALTITLYPVLSSLDEQVVIGYGTTKRRELTAAVTTVDMDKVSEIASPSINDEMGGRMPGVFVALNGAGPNSQPGGPGAQASIYVRGGNGGNNPPLFVIDGFIRTQTDYLNINPNDVESFVVLKDAEATAIYGSQGANGVILVTTKKGMYKGKTSFNYTFNQIWTQPTITPKTVSSYQQALAINQAYQNQGLTPPYADSVLQYYQNQSEPYVYPNTNWQGLVLKKFAEEDRHDFSISAGNDNLRYYGALSYYYQGSLLKEGSSNANNKRVTYRLNVENNLKQLGLKITAGLDGYVNTNVQPNSVDGGYYGIYSHAVDLGPMLVATNQYGLPYSGTNDNPLMETGPQAGFINATQKTFNSILGLDWQLPFFKDIHLKGIGNYNMYYTTNTNWNQTAPGYDLNSTTPIYVNQPNLIQTNGDGTTLDLQGLVTYNHAFGKNHIAFTGVYEQIQGQNESTTAERQSFLIDIPQIFVGPTANQSTSGVAAKSASEGWVARLQYNYAGKYFLEGSFRDDGSYLFPPNKRFGQFYGVSGGWIASDENFFRPLKDRHILDYLKVRGSYGLVGNTNGISPFEYLATYTTNANAYVVNGTPELGLQGNNQLPSNSFTWYSNYSNNIGVDFATLENRLSGSFDRFYYLTKGFVVSDTAYAQTLGASLPYVNSNASQRTAGIEFGLNWDDKAGAFKYHVGVTYSNYQTLYPIYPGESATAMENPYTRQSGKADGYYNFNNGPNQPSTGFNNGPGYIAIGLYPSNNSVLNGALLSGSSNVAGGDIRYKDVNGDGQVNGNDQRLVGANNFAHTNYGLNFALEYKGWSLDGAFMGTGNRDIELGSVAMGEQNMLQYPYQYNYWTPSNPGAYFPRELPNQGYNGNNNTVNSTYWLVNARYFRLKSLNLSYDLKHVGVLKRFRYIDRMKVFVTGRNLFTISNTLKYYIDPESNPNNWGYGVQRTFAVGCNLGF